jgi:type I restriction enzyme R subunit
LGAPSRGDAPPDLRSGKGTDRRCDQGAFPKPSLSELTPEFATQAQQARNPQLAIEALRKLVAEESAKVSRNNLIRQRAFSERVTELMIRYTNQQLTSAEVIAELVELAREVAAESNRGARFTPQSPTTNSPSTTL